MFHATAIVLALLALVAYGISLTNNPLMILGLLLIPQVIQGIPWMLAVGGNNDEDQDSGGQANPRIGFTHDLDNE